VTAGHVEGVLPLVPFPVSAPGGRRSVDPAWPPGEARGPKR
jgi:hypothetical protein